MESLITVSGILEPPPLRTADQWADEHRILPEGSPEPGPWRSSRVPYTRAICQAVSDHQFDTVVAVMGSQMGKTETELNVLGHRFTDGPFVPAMYVGPTEKQVRSMSSDRFQKLLESTPVLLDRLEKGHRDKVTEKFIGGIRMGFAWAGSATELASHPAGLVVVDERSRMANDVNGEGDVVEIIRARLSNYPGGTLMVVSTPTIEGVCPTWKLFEEGTMMKWAWPCPHCNQYFIPRIELLKWNKESDVMAAADSARLVCDQCGSEEIYERNKYEMNENGIFIPHVLSSSGEHIRVEKPTPNSTASFWVSGLASPWVSVNKRAERLINAYQSKEPERIQAAINTGFGELFKESGEAPEWEEVAGLIRDRESLTLPPNVGLITLGSDVQKYGVYWVIRAWSSNKSWKLDSGYLSGETEYDDVWLQLDRIVTMQIQGRKIDRVFVDSGYKPGRDTFRRPDHMVYRFARRHPGLVYPTKGHEIQDKPLKSSRIDITESGRTVKGGVLLWHIDTDHFKSWIHSRIRQPEGVEPDFLLDAGTDEDYCRQMVNEQVVVKPSGRRVWVERGANHYFDCEVLARAAAVSLQVHALKDVQTDQRPSVSPEDVQNQGFVSGVNSRPQGSFFSRYRG